jgi:hypothetical protein
MVFSFGKTQPIRTFQLIKENSLSPSGWGPCFRQPFLGRNCEIPFHALSCFRFQMMKPDIDTGEDVVNSRRLRQHVIPSTVRKCSFRRIFSIPYARKNFPPSPRTQCALFQSVLQFLWHVSILSADQNCCRFLMFCWQFILKYACNQTNLMHYFKFIESLHLYMFRGWVARPSTVE